MPLDRTPMRVRIVMLPLSYEKARPLAVPTDTDTFGRKWNSWITRLTSAHDGVVLRDSGAGRSAVRDDIVAMTNLARLAACFGRSTPHSSSWLKLPTPRVVYRGEDSMRIIHSFVPYEPRKRRRDADA